MILGSWRLHSVVGVAYLQGESQLFSHPLRPYIAQLNKVILEYLNAVLQAFCLLASAMESPSKSIPRWCCDQILEHVFSYIVEPADRAAISEMNKQWFKIEGLTRRSVVVKFPYAVHPSRLAQRFKRLEHVTIKGRPRVSEWGLLGNTWGGNAEPWIKEIVDGFSALVSIHFRRLGISDSAIAALVQKFCNSLEVLKLDRCSGFSTSGLLAVTQNCRKLRVLCLDESLVEDAGKEWLHALAGNSSSLEVLSFGLTGLEVESLEDLAAIIERNKALTCFRLGEVRVTSNVDISNAKALMSAAQSLKDLLLLYRSQDHVEIVEHFNLPKSLTSLAGDFRAPLDSTLASRLVKLDLILSTLQGSDAHQEVVKSCPNDGNQQVGNVIGDEGIETIAKSCSKLKRIRIENLQYLAIYTSDLNNAALAAFGKCCPHLYDFRIAVLDSTKSLSELPLDAGAKQLLQGCKKIVKLALYLKVGGLSDQGLEEIGRVAGNLKWLLLGSAGNSDAGFLKFAAGCHNLAKLELRQCPFSEAAIAGGAAKMSNLRLLWCQGYTQIETTDLLSIGPAWNIEYIPSSEATQTQFLAYRSLSGPRCDCPPEIVNLV